MKAKLVLLIIVMAFFTNVLAAKEKPVSKYDVTWRTLGVNENSSMPLGNGDIAANVWTEQNGDIVLLLAKTDSWSEKGQLLKLGRVRIALNPNPFKDTRSFVQQLRLEDGSVELSDGKSIVRIWADANHPVVRVKLNTAVPTTARVRSEIWRSQRVQLNDAQLRAQGFFEQTVDNIFDADTVFAAKKGQMAWCHFNRRSIYPDVLQCEHLASLLSKYTDPLLHRCSGVIVGGEGLVSKSNLCLESGKPSVSQLINIYALTEQTPSADSWLKDARLMVKNVEKIGEAKAWSAHTQWWADFWNRSWIDVSGAADAEKVSQSYAIMRFMSACAGRGSCPMKFNGSLFTVGRDVPLDSIAKSKYHNPDFRRWGACYWNQNVRHLYWPMIAAGDYDMLMPWFDMYIKALPLAKDRTQVYFKHDGASFIETMYFWGLPCLNDFGKNNPNFDPQSTYMRYHIQGGLEVATQMLDYYDNTLDKTFARNSLVPFADAIVTYYAHHWPRDVQGKIRMYPSQSIETYQVNAENPTPDIAGLMNVLPRLLSLPASLTTEAQRQQWAKEVNDLPALPVGMTKDGKLPPFGRGDLSGTPVILPAQRYGGTSNGENPELYTVFPYRLFCLGKPNLQLAKNTYDARLFHLNVCWGQDGQEAALLGLTDDAKKAVVAAFTAYGNQRFSWFWTDHNDYCPDMDNGGGAMTTLQYMVMQCNGKQIRLIPAWPKEWTADFKLHAPYQTIVEGHVENGKIIRLKVTPSSRRADVVGL
jgi:alpha-L-fucosidase 2